MRVSLCSVDFFSFDNVISKPFWFDHSKMIFELSLLRILFITNKINFHPEFLSIQSISVINSHSSVFFDLESMANAPF